MHVIEHDKVKTGACMHTSAGKLPCKFIIHAVGPNHSLFTPRKCTKFLEAMIINILEKTNELEMKSVSIPAI